MTEGNRRLAIRWFNDVWNVRKESIIDEVLGPQAIGHMEGMDVVGPDEFKAARAALLTAFPDLHVTVEATAVDGDNVVVRWAASGTHHGPASGIAATGLPVKFRGMTWFIMREGRLVEGWDSWNLGALLDSLKGGRSVNTTSS